MSITWLGEDDVGGNGGRLLTYVARIGNMLIDGDDTSKVWEFSVRTEFIK